MVKSYDIIFEHTVDQDQIVASIKSKLSPIWKFTFNGGASKIWSLGFNNPTGNMQFE